MIVESIASFAFSVIDFIFSLFSSVQIVTLPVNLTSTLINFMKYGAWVIGADLFGLVFGVIIGWIMFKWTAGLVLFVYRLIPLT